MGTIVIIMAVVRHKNHVKIPGKSHKGETPSFNEVKQNGFKKKREFC